jgi:uncharacterized membrane protein
MPFRFDHPVWLLLLLLAIPIVWLGKRSLASLETSRQWTAIGLRLLVLTIIVFMLAGLQGVKWHNDLTVIAVIDRSESIRRFVKPPTDLSDHDDSSTQQPSIDEWIKLYLSRSSSERKVDDRLGLVTFDGRPTVRSMPAPTTSDPEDELESGTLEQPIEGTDVAAGVRLGMAVFPGDTAKRMVLVTDGNDTTGAINDLLAVAREAAAAGIPIDVLPLEFQVTREVMVEAVHAPADVRQGQTVSLRVVLRATHPAPGLLHVMHDGLPVDLQPQAPGNALRIEQEQWRDQDVLVKRIQVPLKTTGVNLFEAIFEADKGADAMASNNRAQSFTLVQGKGRILILDGIGGESGMILPQALSQRGIEAQVLPHDELPVTLAELQRYDAVVLHNVAAEAVSTTQQQMLANYVSSLGGGLVMIGGPDSFGAGGWTHTPVDKILPVNCEIDNQTILPSGALMMVLDHSGSMGATPAGSKMTKQELANHSAALASRTLFSRDYIGVISFNDEPVTTHPLSLYTQPHEVENAITRILQGGGTNIYGPLLEAYKALINITDPNVTLKHIILLTDGQGRGGDYDTLLKDLRRKGITLTTIGVGDSIDKKLLTMLGKQGGGTFYHITNPNNLPHIFIKEARKVRKTLIREVAFTPIFNRKSRSPILAGISKAPVLLGLVRTGAKKDPRIFMPLLGPEGEPLFAHWQVQLGRVAAFTSDATNRWAVEWLPWGGYADFWARTMRAIARPTASRDFDLVTTIENNMLKIHLDAGSASAGMKVRGTVMTPDNQSVEVKLDAIAPGIFEAQLPASEQGSYIVSLFAERRGELQYVYGGANRTPGNELRHFKSNRAVLEQVAALTGGRVLDPNKIDPEALFARNQSLKPSRSIRPLWRVLMVWLLVLFMLDVALRRLSWNPAAVLLRLRRIRGASSPRDTQAVQQTLTTLKDRAREKEQAAAELRIETAKTAAKAEQNIAEAAKNAQAGDAIQTVEPTKKRQPATGTTHRLLDAKRRAQQRLDNNDQ